MSNIIDGVDFGMGYERATKWDPRLQWWEPNSCAWRKASVRDQKGMDREIETGTTYRRPLPILANHPEAIPLEPGDVLQVGDRGLTRDGRDTGELEANKQLPYWYGRGYTLFSKKLGWAYTNDGKFSSTMTEDGGRVVARLPREAQQEPEKGKDGKEMRVTGEHINHNRVEISLSEAARIAQPPEAVAYVEKQRKEKEIGPGDLFVYRTAIYFCDGVDTGGNPKSFGSGYDKRACHKLNLPPDLIALLNAEIEKAKGAK